MVLELRGVAALESAYRDEWAERELVFIGDSCIKTQQTLYGLIPVATKELQMFFVLDILLHPHVTSLGSGQYILLSY
jgi:hypothetical protein